MNWQVCLRGPEARDSWRVVLVGDESEARARWVEECERLHTGHLLLIDDAGKPVWSVFRSARAA